MRADLAGCFAVIHPRLWRFCVVMTGDRADAEDLVQQTYLRALEKQKQYQEDGKLDRWLFTLARRIWLNECRARKLRVGRGLEQADEAGLASDEPESEASVFATQVLKKIMKLPSEQSLTVLLVYREGQSYREAADILDCPIGTIMSRLAAARTKLNRDCPREVDE